MRGWGFETIIVGAPKEQGPKTLSNTSFPKSRRPQASEAQGAQHLSAGLPAEGLGLAVQDGVEGDDVVPQILEWALCSPSKSE